ncbi:type II toxin-antitoxin system VapC family toxin [Tianweitania sp. BSSL-BM11]|uniref:Type II toxin-antitoxin system VapC family toxin n=1 Tax=Tianweitania aestuarii TaxID=2814886 RepID=A0ABS5RX13_9HYPH|nr:type II toxin-antitoxin system VapC family toxin [Tianweitania aestuarii]MBS9721611.1 type II toxin-antitoxin system VapC family toxin [Tianweitania aestuarii]
MSHILLDTHAWAWSLTADSRLSASALAAMEGADRVSISAISLFEIGQKVRLGKWPEMQPFLTSLIRLADEQGGRFLDVSPEVSLVAATLDWAHRDPFDRIIGATALTRGLTLISADMAFDGLAAEPKWPGRIW